MAVLFTTRPSGYVMGSEEIEERSRAMPEGVGEFPHQANEGHT